MGDWILSRMMFPMTLAGCPLMALAGLGCLFFCKGKERRRLTWAAGVFLSALALFFGGMVLLGFFDMTWRNLPAAVLCGVLLVSGWAGIVLTLACLLPMEWKEVAPVLRWASKGVIVLFAAVVLVVTLWLGPMLLAFAYSGGERVVEYQGQTLLEVDEGFLDPCYSYYPYHGPLVRGTERLYSSPTHIWGDFEGEMP